MIVWRVRYKLSLRDLAEMFLIRGFTFTHEAVRDWEARFTPLMAERLRAKRHRRGGVSWYADETYIKIKGNGPTCTVPSCDPFPRKGDKPGMEVRYWFRPRQWMKQAVSLAVKRQLFVERFTDLNAFLIAA